MHILNSKFEIDRIAALNFAANRGFGLVVAQADDRPIGSHLPFTLHSDGDINTLQCHITRPNPLAGLADGQRSFLVVITGADMYVSNDWYVSPDQVSTWLYEAVHLTGVARQLPEEANRQHGDDLLWNSERLLVPKKPWHLDSMDPQKRTAMLKAIVTLEITIDTVEGQRKLNQHKSDADHIAVVQALERSSDPAKQNMAQVLRSLRPHLEHDCTVPAAQAKGKKAS